MIQFNPTIRIVQPRNDPDLLAGAALNSLTRPLYFALSWGVFRSFVVTILTLGIVPVLMPIRWMRGIIAQHEQQLWHLAEWIRLQSGDPDAAELGQLARRIRFNATLALLAGFGALIAAVAVAAHLAAAGFRLGELYGFAFQLPRSLDAIVFTIAISAAAMCNWAHLAWHRRNTEQYLRGLNQVMIRLRLDPLPPRTRRTEPGWSWIIGGVALLLAGGLWGLPVMLAAGAHRRYTIGTSVRVRAMLAERLREMLARRRPAIDVPKPVSSARICIRPNCRAPMPSVAGFCPRCGASAAGALEVA